MNKTFFALVVLAFSLHPPLPAQTAPNASPNMVLIKGGTFTMGSPANEPEHIVDETHP